MGGMRGGGWVNSVMGKMVREGVNSRNWSVGTRGLYVRKFTSLSVGRRVQTVLSSAAIAVVRGSTPVRPNFSMTELLFIHCTFGFIISYFMHNSTFDYMLVHVMICSLWGYLPRSICVLCIQRIAYYICESYIFINGLGGMGGGGVNYDMRRVVRVSENSGHWSVRWRGLYGCKTACICVGVVSWWFRRWGLNSWSEIETRMAQLFSCHRSCSFIYIGIILSCFTH